MAKRQNAHYVNNADFSLAVVDYVKKAGEAKSKKEEVPKVTDYIATCFLKIAEGLSHKANFISENENADVTASQVTNSFVDVLKNRIDKIKVKDEKIKTLTKQIKKRRRVVVDSDLEEFML